MAADDVAKAVGRIAVGAPLNGTVEVAGPQQFRFDDLIRQSVDRLVAPGVSRDNSSSMISLKAAYGSAPATKRPFMKNVGVADTP